MESKIPMPSGFKVSKGSDLLSISWRYNRLASILGLVFSCGFIVVSIGMTVFFVTEIYSKVKFTSFLIVLGINLAFGIVSLLFFFYALAHVVNRYEVVVRNGKLIFLFGPVPSILTRRKKSVNTNEISEVYVYPWLKKSDSKAGRVFTTLWKIYIHDKKGQTIIGHFTNDLQHSMFIEQELRGFLNIKNYVRRGLYFDCDEYWNNGHIKHISYTLRGEMKNTRIEINDEVNERRSSNIK